MRLRTHGSRRRRALRELAIQRTAAGCSEALLHTRAERPTSPSWPDALALELLAVGSPSPPLEPLSAAVTDLRAAVFVVVGALRALPLCAAALGPSSLVQSATCSAPSLPRDAHLTSPTSSRVTSPSAFHARSSAGDTPAAIAVRPRHTLAGQSARHRRRGRMLWPSSRSRWWPLPLLRRSLRPWSRTHRTAIKMRWSTTADGEWMPPCGRCAPIVCAPHHHRWRMLAVGSTPSPLELLPAADGGSIHRGGRAESATTLCHCTGAVVPRVQSATCSAPSLRRGVHLTPTSSCGTSSSAFCARSSAGDTPAAVAVRPRHTLAGQSARHHDRSTTQSL